MKLSFVFSLCCSILLLTACSKDPKAISFELDKVFELSFEQNADLQEGDLSLLFATVNEDSRCPTEVTCVWEGQVVITLQVGEGRALTEIKMTRNGALSANEPTIATYGDYDILLTEVSPYPKNTDSIKDKNYELTLEIRKR